MSFAANTLAPSYACASGGSIPMSRGCFKAQFQAPRAGAVGHHGWQVPAGEDFVEVRVPLEAFSDRWSPATGEATVRCSEDPEVCPKGRDLSHIQRLELWAEGALGHVHLEAGEAPSTGRG